jgi:4-hydroxy-tetrahydrodipicolinate reductase
MAREAGRVRVVLIGATGRMGLSLMRTSLEFPQLQVTGAIASPGSSALGRDAATLAGLPAAQLPVSADLASALQQADVAVDFSQGQAVTAHLAVCRAARKPLLIGTTGFSIPEPELRAVASGIALMIAPNTSVGVALLTELTRQAAAVLPDSFDVDVLEIHHRGKADAPSGTALALGQAAAQGRGVPFSAARPGPGARSGNGIGMAVVRAGEHVGEHSVLFSGGGEVLTLAHRASDRAVFARGALQAALWLSAASPGLYGMRDFISFKTVT